MIRYNVLLRAMGYMFLPSFSVLFLLFVWFLHWGRFVDFITSQSVGSSFVRMIMLVLEIVFIWILYEKFLKEQLKKEEEEKQKTESQKVIDAVTANGIKLERFKQGGFSKYSKNVELTDIISDKYNYYSVYGTPESPNKFLITIE